ncbi:MAG: signal peptidase I [Clostridia bacterium]|nr:signal peptidase I [Clostridia bacterium]
MNMKRKQTTRKILRILLSAVVCLAFGFGLYTWNATALAGNPMPMPFGVGVGVIVSGSMEPELSIDDVIVVKRASSYDVGDVVVFQHKASLVVHKIIAIEGNTVTTQGTANTVADDPISITDIKGTVWFHIDGLGGVISWMQSPLGTGAILLLAGILLIKSYSVENREERQKRDEVEELKKEIERIKGNSSGSDDSTPS